MKSSIERFCYFLCYESEVVKSTNFNHLRNLKKNFPCDVLRTRCRWNVFFLLKWRRASFFREFSSIFFLSFGAFSGFFFHFSVENVLPPSSFHPHPEPSEELKKRVKFFSFFSTFFHLFLLLLLLLLFPLLLLLHLRIFLPPPSFISVTIIIIIIVLFFVLGFFSFNPHSGGNQQTKRREEKRYHVFYK